MTTPSHPYESKRQIHTVSPLSTVFLSNVQKHKPDALQKQDLLFLPLTSHHVINIVLLLDNFT